MAGFTPQPAGRVASARSGYAQKIALANLDTIVTKDAVGGRGMEIEIRECKAIEEFLTLQRQGFIGADREGDFAAVSALELRGRKLLEVVAGLGQPLPQFFECFFSVSGVDGTSTWASRAQPLLAKSHAS